MKPFSIRVLIFYQYFIVLTRDEREVSVVCCGDTMWRISFQIRHVPFDENNGIHLYDQTTDAVSM